MAENSVQRRLAAILAADVVGYSRLVGQDEDGTLAAVRKLRAEVIEPKIAEHQGRLFKTTGDGFLVEFPSVVNAVTCAVAIQKMIVARNADLPQDRAIQLRIGVNLGDVVVEGDDVLGDGVNVAARLESIASPGGIAISGTVRDHLGSRLNLDLEDLGERHLKNIQTPIRVLLIGSGVAPTPQAKWSAADKPSIAVLPFANMSDDSEHEYFADGIVEDIITALSRFKSLFVIARNSSFVYKGRAVDIKQVGRELSVRYVLEGSVRKAANRLRITAQLIDAGSGSHLWAERYDGALEDVFSLQDQVTARVVGAIFPRLELAEIEASKRKSTTSLSAYDHYLRGMAALNEWTVAGANEGLLHFYRAIDLDPTFAAAYGRAAGCFTLRMSVQSAPLDQRELAEAERLARLAAELGRMDDIALADAGNVLDYVLGDHRSGLELIERALALNPNNAQTWRYASWAKQWNGQFDAAIDCCLRVLELSPQDPSMFQTQSAMAFAHFSAGRHGEALAWAEKALSDRPNHSPALQATTACLIALGRQREAEDVARRLVLADPAFTIRSQQDLLPYRNSEHLAKWQEAFRKAGLPE